MSLCLHVFMSVYCTVYADVSVPLSAGTYVGFVFYLRRG